MDVPKCGVGSLDEVLEEVTFSRGIDGLPAEPLFAA